MTRRLPQVSVADLVADGLTEDEIATRFDIWLSDLESFPTVDLAVNEADELRRGLALDARFFG